MGQKFMETCLILMEFENCKNVFVLYIVELFRGVFEKLRGQKVNMFLRTDKSVNRFRHFKIPYNWLISKNLS